MLYGNEKRYEEALADLNRAIELAPGWVDAYLNRGQIHAAMELYEEALADFERDIEWGGEGLNLRRQQANALRRLGRIDEAVQVLREFVEKNPKNENARRTLAVMYFDTGNTAAAVATLDRALEIDSEDPTNNMFRAFYSAFLVDDCEDVARRLRAYEETTPTDPTTWSNVASIQTVALIHTCPALYDPSKALEHARRAADYDSQNGNWQGVLGIALYRTGALEEAKEFLERAFELESTKDVAKLFTLSMVHWQLGDKEEARTVYREAVQEMERTLNERADARLMREEAAELLGIQP